MSKAIQQSLFDAPEMPPNAPQATLRDEAPISRVPVQEEPPPLSWAESLSYYFGGRYEAYPDDDEPDD